MTPLNANCLRSFRDVISALGKLVGDIVLFKGILSFFQVEIKEISKIVRRGNPLETLNNIVRLDNYFFGHYYQALNNDFEFSNITRPGIVY